VAAWAGVIGLLTGDIDFGDTLDERLPFDNLAVAGAALAVIVAIPLSVLAWLAWSGHRRTNEMSLLVGIALLGWIVLQVLILRSVSLFQAVYLGVGVYFVDASHLVRWSRASRSIGRIAVGVAMLAIGVGLLPHLIDDTVSVAAALAIATIIGGITLVVAGARLGLAGRSVGERIAGTITTILAALLAIWFVAPGVAATNVPPSTITTTPADLGLTYDSVELTTDDDVRLAAWYLPGSSDAAVLVLHGAGSTRSAALDQAAVLQRNGYGVLLVDARGHGESDGSAMDFGWYGDLDIGAGTDYLAERGDVDADRVGVLGLSMGGEEAIGAAATNPALSAVVAEGATGRTAADKDWLSDVYGWRGAAQEQVEKIQFGVTDLLTTASPPRSLLDAVSRATRTPFLLITAGTVADEQHVADALRGAAPDRVAVWNVDEAAHTGGLDTDPAAWERRVIDFLDQHLRTP
jgi:pimeloyl-ACP methyl ester carboxylesterase